MFRPPRALISVLFLMTVVAAVAESPAAPSVFPPGSCAGMFGLPGESTGLDSTRCAPRCDFGDGAFQPPVYREEDARAIEAWTLLDPPAELTEDPYGRPGSAAVRDGGVCAVVADSVETQNYRLRTFESEGAAREAGAWITHTGTCGVCSGLTDLAVYMRHGDLATPVRQCGLDHFLGSMEAHVQCLEAIGFTRPCAQIWYYNTRHTGKACLGVCLASLGDAYHRADGSLNACIQCDEDESGAVFKAVAGRTRRNSGLPSALCRPCDSVGRLEHRYPPVP